MRLGRLGRRLEGTSVSVKDASKLGTRNPLARRRNSAGGLSAKIDVVVVVVDLAGANHINDAKVSAIAVAKLLPRVLVATVLSKNFKRINLELNENEYEN